MKFDVDNVYCGSIKRGDIFSVHDGTERVVVVVQDTILNERLSSVLVVPLVGHVAGQTVFKNELLLKLSETTFAKPGICLPAEMFAADRRTMRAKRGELSPERLQELLNVIDINLGRFRD